MICYPANANETEISAINDYWLQSEKSFTGFTYTLKEINERYQDKKIKPITSLAKSSCFLPSNYQAIFTCGACKKKEPATSRQNYTRRTKSKAAMICQECETTSKQRIRSEARRIIDQYKADKFQTQPYLDELGFEESLALLTLLSDHDGEGSFIGESPDDITITGIPTLDHQLFYGLVDKMALIYIDKLPEAVERANTEIYGVNRRLTYHDRYRKSLEYRNPNSITNGIFLNAPYSEQSLSIPTITALLYEKLNSRIVSIEDTAKIHQLIKEVQIQKLFQLVIHISQEYKLPIDNSPTLQSLLSHLAENYPPNKLFYTFHRKAKDTIAYIHKQTSAPYIAKNYFSKFVGEYVQYVEERGFKLIKTWSLPPSVGTSSFEAIFSQIYLNGQFNWNRLSAKEVVTLWLENISLSQELEEFT